MENQQSKTIIEELNKTSCEIKENAKGRLQVTVKVYGETEEEITTKVWQIWQNNRNEADKRQIV
ncbi:MAG: hypothetical protein ACTSPV_16670 [Candidatus Hodarchaeales archaeon]